MITVTSIRPVRKATCLLPLLAAAVACSDPTAPRATEPTATAAFTVFAFTGTSPGYPSGFSVPANTAVRLDGNFFFDVAFDIDEQGRVLIYPLELIAWRRVDIHRVGVVKATEGYDQVTRAPDSGFIFDQVMIGEAGDTFILDSGDSRICAFPFPSHLYAKFEIQSIDLTTRSIGIRATQNPNCGFHSFLEGIPAD
jgi:hypothetical protein